MNKSQNDPTGEKRFSRFHILALVPLLAILGCKQETKVTADANPVGTYNLVTVDGSKVPCTVKHEGATPTIKSGTFTINADGTCSSRIFFTMPAGADMSREVKATYTHQGAKFAMQWEGAGSTTATLEGDTFTMNNEGMIFAYRK
jgi:hypothetical protein